MKLSKKHVMIAIAILCVLVLAFVWGGDYAAKTTELATKEQMTDETPDEALDQDADSANDTDIASNKVRLMMVSEH